jgi:hypothetical protein
LLVRTLKDFCLFLLFGRQRVQAFLVVDLKISGTVRILRALFVRTIPTTSHWVVVRVVNSVIPSQYIYNHSDCKSTLLIIDLADHEEPLLSTPPGHEWRRTILGGPAHRDPVSRSKWTAPGCVLFVFVKKKWQEHMIIILHWHCVGRDGGKISKRGDDVQKIMLTMETPFEIFITPDVSAFRSTGIVYSRGLRPASHRKGQELT